MGDTAEAPVRERILDAALSLLRDVGAKKLAQPQVARLAGVPQGHLTYYFPRKLDLLVAVGRRFTQMVKRDLAPFLGGPAWDAQDETARERALGFVAKLVRDRERTRMLLRLLVEADGDSELRAAMAEGAGFVRSVLAQTLGKPKDDPDVDVALAMLWGLGIQHLVLQRSDEETDAVLARTRAWIDRMAREGKT